MRLHHQALLACRALMSIPTAWELRDDCLLFRGSANVQDLCDDACMRLAPTEAVRRDDGSLRPLMEGEAHAGFVRRYMELRHELPRTPPRYVAGHSLGAALAMLYMADVASNQTTALLFGAPRLGDDACMRGYERDCGRRTFVFQNTRDVVTAMPPGPRYRHGGQQILFRGAWFGHNLEHYERQILETLLTEARPPTTPRKKTRR